MRIRIGKRSLVAVMATTSVVAAGIMFGLTTRETKAERIQVRGEGAVVSSTSVEDAVLEGSKRVGFPIKLPADLPDRDLKLEYIDTDVGPPGVASPLKKATLAYVSRTTRGAFDLSVQIEE